MSQPRHVLTPGAPFGRLTVIRPGPDQRSGLRRRPTSWVACSCGSSFIALNTNLLNGGTRSCGCARLKAVALAGARRKRANLARKAAQATAIALLSGALGAQSLISDPLAAGTTHCGLRVENDPVVDVPVVLAGSGLICKVNLIELPVAGSYEITLTSIVAGPPRAESVPSAKFHLRETAQPNSARVRWQGWTNLFCPDSGAACYWE